MRLALFYLVFVLFGLQGSYGQTAHLDSLKIELQQASNDTIKIILLNEMAIHYRGISADSTLLLVKDALTLSEKINYTKGIANSNLVMGISKVRHGSLIEALAFLEIALKMARDNDFSELQAKSLNAFGLIHTYQGNYPLALDYYQQALNISTTIDTRLLTSEILNNIGGLYYNQDDYEQALDYWQRTLAIRVALGVDLAAAGSMNNIGLAYSDMENFSKSLSYYFQALNLYPESAFCLKIYPYSNIANIYYQTSKLDSAEYYYRIVFSRLQECKDPVSQIWTLRGLGRVSVGKKHYTEALMYYERAIKIADDRSMNLELRSLLKEQSELYEKLGKIELAFDSFKKYNTLGDSLYNDQKSKAIGRLEAKFEFDKKQREKEVEQRFQEAENKRQRTQQLWIRNAFLAGFIVMIIIAAMIYRDYKRKVKANQKLIALNIEINKQQEMLQTQSVKLQELNDSLNSLNDNLELKIAKRTRELSEKNIELEAKNIKMEEYAFMNAHKLRAPIATLLGLIQLFDMEQIDEIERNKIVDKIKNCTLKLDDVVKEIMTILNNA